jgi:hypothetical protein
MILTISYHNEATVKRSYEQLAKTIKDTPMEVFLLDNNYPLNKNSSFVYKICHDLGFTYINLGENVGLQAGYNFLLNATKDKGNKVILFDGDCYPETKGWNKALFDVLDSEEVKWATLRNEHSYKELNERGYEQTSINGYSARIVKQPVINSTSAYKRDWLESKNGISEPRKYYGGFEWAMWRKMNLEKDKWVFLDDFNELTNAGELTDEIYTEFKYKYAHLGMDMSFEQYVLRTDLHGNFTDI